MENLSNTNSKIQNSFITEFSQIKEERYYDLMDCLPPKRWHTYKEAEIFYMCEAFTDDIYTCCVAYEDKFFSALRPIREDSENILLEVKKAYRKI